MGRKANGWTPPGPPEQARLEYRHLTEAEKAHLGMPRGALGVSHSFDGVVAGRHWAGYRITHVGLLLATLLPSNPKEPIPATPWPHWEIIYPGLGPVPMQVWRRIITHTQTPTYVQARWSPDLGHTRIDVVGLERCQTEKERAIAFRADKLLRFDLTTWKKTNQEAREDLKAALAFIKQKAREQGTRPRFDRRTVSGALFLSESGYDDFLRHHRLRVTRDGQISER